MGLWLFLAFAPLTAAHPYHASGMEAQWNEAEARLEVALRVKPEDLRRALERQEGVEMPWKAMYDPSSDEAIARYLERKVVLTRGEQDDEESAKLTWVGKDLDVAEAWLYFTLAWAPTEAAEEQTGKAGLAALQQARLEVRVFFELEPTQVNTLTLLLGDERRTVTLTRERAVVEITDN